MYGTRRTYAHFIYEMQYYDQTVNTTPLNIMKTKESEFLIYVYVCWAVYFYTTAKDIPFSLLAVNVYKKET